MLPVFALLIIGCQTCIMLLSLMMRTCPRHPAHVDGTKSCTCTIVHRHGCPCCPETRVVNGHCICQEEWNEHRNKRNVWHFPDRVHGFVAGCYWGDDGSWKIQYLDLSRAEEGIITREERFGYIELPEHLTLQQAVDLDVHEDYSSLRISTQSDYDLKTGKKQE
jgi:hypothetical protein